jgi:excisionase family DNA binding protein
MAVTTAAHESEFLTIAQVAERLGVSVATVRRKIAAGYLPATQLGGKRSSIRVAATELESWLYAEPEDA